MIDRPGTFTDICAQHGIPVVVTDVLDPTGGPTVFPEEYAVQSLIDQFRSFGADVIHCHTVRAASQAIPAANRVNLPCVFTADGSQPVVMARKMGLRFATICLSEASFAELSSDAPESIVDYIPNGTKVMARPPRATGPARSPELIMVGSLISRKGVDIAILAVSELRRRRGRECPVLNIYGDGNQREYLAEMAAVLELDDVVRFHGFRKGILERCPSTDVFVLSSRLEAGPLVVLEAMSHGMPIVATDVGEVTKMLPDQRYGRVVAPGSIVPLAEAIESLLADLDAGRFDPGLLIDRHRALYSDEKMAARTEAVYDEARASCLAAGSSVPG